MFWIGADVRGSFGCFGTALRAGGAPPLNPARRAPVPPYPHHESGAPPPHPQAYSAADNVRDADPWANLAADDVGTPHPQGPSAADAVREAEPQAYSGAANASQAE